MADPAAKDAPFEQFAAVGNDSSAGQDVTSIRSVVPRERARSP